MAYFAGNQLLMQGVQQQIVFTMILYTELLKTFNVEIIPVKTGNGFIAYNTPTDIVLALRLK